MDWQKIIDEYGRLVWHQAYKLLGNTADTEECFQDTFTSAVQIVRDQQIDNIGALLCRLVTNNAVDRIRKKSAEARYKDKLVRIGERPDDLEVDPQQLVIKRELAEQLSEKLRNAMGSLTPQEYQVFCMRVILNMTYKEIASELEIKLHAVGSTLNRTKRRLRGLMGHQPEK